MLISVIYLLVLFFDFLAQYVADSHHAAGWAANDGNDMQSGNFCAYTAAVDELFR